MPFICKYKCIDKEECNFQIVDAGSILYIKLEDGKIKWLPHPIEEAEALASTGKNVAQLMKENRAFYKDSELCLSCFKERSGCKCENKNEFITITELEGKQCPKCEKGIIQKTIIGQS